MEHLLLKATTVATDEGTFEAVISTASVDRDGDIVEPDAMVAALKKWAALGKLVPLAWDHTKHVIGHIDPSTARVEANEVVVAGWIDQKATGENNEKLGERAWRLVKSGTLSFSYGMLIPETGATKRANGGLHITELDLYEVSTIPVAPANNDTRVLAWKSLADRDRVITELQEVKDRLHTLEKALEDLNTSRKADETAKERKSARAVDPLRDQARQIAREVMTGEVKPPPQVKEAPKQPAPAMSPDELRAHSRYLIVHVLSGIE